MWVGLSGWVPSCAPLCPRASVFPWLHQLTSPSCLSSPAPPGDGYVQADAQGPRDYEDHLYVNTQGLDASEPLQPEDSPKKDLFDMRMWGQAILRGTVLGGRHSLLPWGLLPLGLSKLMLVGWEVCFLRGSLV